MKSWLQWFSLCTAVTLYLCSSVGRAAENRSSALQYLFLIDTSLPMARHKAELARAIGTRISTGLDGLMRTGDMFALWTYDETVSTNRYLPMVWIPTAGEALAGHLSRTWEQQPFGAESRVDKALAEATPLIASSETFTLLIISDGSSPVRGTPFDAKINATVKHAINQDGGSGTLFVTTLLARDGQVVAWAVATAGGQSIPAAPVASLETQDFAPLVTRELTVGPQPAESNPAGPNRAIHPITDTTRSLASDQPEPKNSLSLTNASSMTVSTQLDSLKDVPVPEHELPPISAQPLISDLPPPHRQALLVSPPPQPSSGLPADVEPHAPRNPKEVKGSSKVMAPAPLDAALVSKQGTKAGTLTAAPVRDGSPARGFLALGLVLFVAALSGLIYGARATKRVASPSLISRSIEPHRDPSSGSS